MDTVRSTTLKILAAQNECGHMVGRGGREAEIHTRADKE